MRSRQWPWRTKKLACSQCRRDASKRVVVENSREYFFFFLFVLLLPFFFFPFPRATTRLQRRSLRLRFIFRGGSYSNMFRHCVHLILIGKSKLELLILFFFFLCAHDDKAKLRRDGNGI